MLEVTNAGNVVASGSLAVALSAEAAPAGSGDAVALATVTKKIRLGAGASSRLRLTFLVPKALAAGTYQLAGLIDSDNRFAESDEGNNLATSPGAFTVR